MKSGTRSDFQPNVMMLGLSPSDYVLRAISNVTTNDLEQTLLVFAHSFSIIFLLVEFRMMADIFGSECACVLCAWVCIYLINDSASIISAWELPCR